MTSECTDRDTVKITAFGIARLKATRYLDLLIHTCYKVWIHIMWCNKSSYKKKTTKYREYR